MTRSEVVLVDWPYSILTIDEVRIDAVIGYLSDAAMLQLETCLKRVLELR